MFSGAVLLILPILSAPGLEISVCPGYQPIHETREQNIILTITAENFPAREITESLNAGHRVRVEYEMRVYHDRTGWTSFLGDYLQETSSVRYEAWKDPITLLYTVSTLSTSRNPVNFLHRDELLNYLKSLQDHVIPLQDVGPKKPSPKFLLVRIRVLTEVLVPPFNILSPILPDLRKTTPWTRKEIHPCHPVTEERTP